MGDSGIEDKQMPGDSNGVNSDEFLLTYYGHKDVPFKYGTRTKKVLNCIKDASGGRGGVFNVVLKGGQRNPFLGKKFKKEENIIGYVFEPEKLASTQTQVGLDHFLFSELESDVLKQTADVHFSTHPLELAPLQHTATALISQVRAELDEQMKECIRGPYNVYCYGMKASGKTHLLKAIAKQLQSEDYIVYFFKNARLLDTMPLFVRQLPITQKVAVIVDNVQTGSTAGTWTLLLKNTGKNLVVIGAGTVKIDNLDGPISHFRGRMSVNLFPKFDNDIIPPLLINKADKPVPKASDATIIFQDPVKLQPEEGHISIQQQQQPKQSKKRNQMEAHLAKDTAAQLNRRNAKKQKHMT